MNKRTIEEAGYAPLEETFMRARISASSASAERAVSDVGSTTERSLRAGASSLLANSKAYPSAKKYRPAPCEENKMKWNLEIVGQDARKKQSFQRTHPEFHN